MQKVIEGWDCTVALCKSLIPIYFSPIFPLLCDVLSSFSFCCWFFFWPPFFPEQTGMPMPTTGMPACVHSSLAGTSEKSLLPVKVDCWAFGLLNSLKIFTGVFNRMQSLLEWKKCWCLCVLGMWAWCVILHYLDIVGADWTAGSGRCAVKTPHCLPEAIKPCTSDQ